MSNLLIYQNNVKKAYLYLIKENLKLIKKLLEEKNNLVEPYNPNKDFILYEAKAKHFQIMNLLGSTAEHLIKLILLKRGFILNEGISTFKFSPSFMSQIERFNEEHITQEKMDNLYSEAEKDINFSFSNKLIKFDKCIQLFNQDNNTDYFGDIQEYILSPHPEVYDGDEYFGYKIIKPDECLRVIQKSRNNYMHLLEGQYEQNGIIWYFINFLVWLAKKEFPDFFNDEEYVGSDENKSLFGI